MEALATLLARSPRSEVAWTIEITAEPIDVESLAARVETDDGHDDARLRTRLHHVDLPKLAVAGLVSFDPSQGLVTSEPPLGPVLTRAGVDPHVDPLEA